MKYHIRPYITKHTPVYFTHTGFNILFLFDRIICICNNMCFKTQKLAFTSIQFLPSLLTLSSLRSHQKNSHRTTNGAKKHHHHHHTASSNTSSRPTVLHVRLTVCVSVRHEKRRAACFAFTRKTAPVSVEHDD